MKCAFRRPSERQITFYIGSALVIGTLLLYWPTVSYEFIIADDYEYICRNPYVLKGLSWSGVKWAFWTMYAANWHPLTWLSHMLDCSIYGLFPGGHHLTNILFHTANTVLLFLLFKRLTGALWPSAFVAALFGWHPLHVQSVAWICERKDVMSTFFLLLTLGAYSRYVRHPARKPYFLALAFFLLGLMSKPMVVTLPFVLLLLDYWPLKRFQNTPTTPKKRPQWLLLFVEKLPFFFLSFLGCLMTVNAQSAGDAVWRPPFLSRITNAVADYAAYIAKAVWPTDLAVFYPMPATPPYRLFLASLLLISLGFALGWRWRLRFPWLIVGWCWFLGTLVPVIGLIQAGAQSMADRYTYVPYIGLFIIFVWTGEHWVRQRPALLFSVCSAGLSLLLGFAIVSRIELHYWHDNIELFNRAVMLAPDNHKNFAVIDLRYALNNRRIDAIPYYLTLRHQKADPKPAYPLFSHVASMGNPDDAGTQLYETLNYDSQSDMLHNNLGLILSEQTEFDEAIQEFQKAIDLNPKSPWPHFNCAMALQENGNAGEAVNHYLKALALRPLWPEALDKLAFLLAACPDTHWHNPAKAVRLAQQANQFATNTSPDYLRTLALAYAATGSFSNALSTAELAAQRAQSAGFKTAVSDLQNELALYRAGKLPPVKWRSPPAHLIVSRQNEIILP